MTSPQREFVDVAVSDVRPHVRRYLDDLVAFEGPSFVLPPGVSDPAQGSESAGEVAMPSSAALERFHRKICECQACPLGKTRQCFVFGSGAADAGIMFVGEAPGANEDREGIPFVGRAGELLTKIIENGMKTRREDVYIANVIKCRPPQNRDPTPEEVATCRPFILEQINMVNPRVIVTLGRVAAQALLQTSRSITHMRGTWQEIEGRPVMPTFHPAYLLRNPAGKRDVWSDIQEVLRFLSEKG